MNYVMLICRGINRSMKHANSDDSDVAMCRLEQEQQRRSMKRPYDSQNARDSDPYWNDNKRQVTSNRYDSHGNYNSNDR